MKQKPWMRCLLGLRAIEERGDSITSIALLEEMGFEDTERTDAEDIASGWISTLRRGGFLKKQTGIKVKGPHRSLQVYKLTPYGIAFKIHGEARAALRIAANPPKDQGKRNTP